MWLVACLEFVNEVDHRQRIPPAIIQQCFPQTFSFALTRNDSQANPASCPFATSMPSCVISDTSTGKTDS
jgi:hypothetical protein